MAYMGYKKYSLYRSYEMRAGFMGLYGDFTHRIIMNHIIDPILFFNQKTVEICPNLCKIKRIKMKKKTLKIENEKLKN